MDPVAGMISECMLFAAGFGTRMQPLTANRPKPLVEVGGQPLIDHALTLATDAGIGRAVVNVHYLADPLRRHLSTIEMPEIRISDETAKILDTGGGLLAAAPAFESNVIATMNPDCIWTGANPFTVLAEAWDPSVADALLLLQPTEAAVAHKGPGDFSLDPDGRVTRRGDADRAPYMYASTQIINRQVLADEPPGKFSLNRVWDRLHRQDRLRAVVFPGRFADVGYPEAIPLAEALLETKT